MADKKSMITWL